MEATITDECLSLIGKSKSGNIQLQSWILQKSVSRGNLPKEIIIPLEKKRLWEAGGFNREKGIGYAIIIAGHDGCPKTAVSLNRSLYPNSKHGNVFISRNDFVIFSFMRIQKGRVGIKGFTVVYQVSHFEDDSATLVLVACHNSFLPPKPEENIPDKCMAATIACIQKSKENNCVSPRFLNLWGIYTPKEDTPFPEITINGNGENINSVVSNDIDQIRENIEEKLVNNKTNFLKGIIQEFEFSDNGLILTTHLNPISIREVRDSDGKALEIEADQVFRVEFDQFHSCLNKRFLFQAKSPEELHEVLKFIENKYTINDNHFILIRSFKG